MRKNREGFTLIELLIVVAIIGIIAAIAIPNLLSAIQRGRQKRSMADMRSIGTACESYSIDNGFVPNVAAGSVAVLTDYVQPTFIRVLPSLDAWKHGFAWDHNAGLYTIGSFGAGAPAGALDCLVGRQTTEFSEDICYANGQFTQWPEGTQN